MPYPDKNVRVGHVIHWLYSHFALISCINRIKKFIHFIYVAHPARQYAEHDTVYSMTVVQWSFCLALFRVGVP